ncbi:ead/Ea22-like family protein [Salmonella enterica subsp. enterica]|nr:ead/Ea22-like family protein [Salmonella enterica subsp. enterica]
MTIDKQALRQKAVKAGGEEWQSRKMPGPAGEYTVIVKGSLEKHPGWTTCRPVADEVIDKKTMDFIAAANPATMLALLDELDSANGYASAYEAEKWHYHGLAESGGERADRAEKRVSELECIATDYGVKFQKAQDALKHQALLHKSQMEAAEKRLAGLSKATSVNSQWKPDVCPVTGRKFFMWIEHETLGYVPTYGGPFDSYTIPTRDSSGEFSCERYDHDFGGWVGGEFIGLYLIDDDEQCRVCELEERIAELEARTVTPPKNNVANVGDSRWMWYQRDLMWIEAIRAAGIKVKGGGYEH